MKGNDWPRMSSSFPFRCYPTSQGASESDAERRGDLSSGFRRHLDRGRPVSSRGSAAKHWQALRETASVPGSMTPSLPNTSRVPTGRSLSLPEEQVRGQHRPGHRQHTQGLGLDPRVENERRQVYKEQGGSRYLEQDVPLASVRLGEREEHRRLPVLCQALGSSLFYFILPQPCRKGASARHS